MNPKKFFSELKRRNVYKVAIAYAVVAWLVMQVVSQIFRSSKFQIGANLVDPTHENRAGLAESSHLYRQEQGREG